MDSRSVYGITLANKKTDKMSLLKLKKLFNADVTEVFADYKMKNTREYLIRDRMTIPDFNIISAKKMNAESVGLRDGPARPVHRIGGLLYFSNIGFNKAGNQALFYIANSGAPHTGYFVFMNKQNGHWLIRDVDMEDMFIE